MDVSKKERKHVVWNVLNRIGFVSKSRESKVASIRTKKLVRFIYYDPPASINLERNDAIYE